MKIWHEKVSEHLPVNNRIAFNQFAKRSKRLG